MRLVQQNAFASVATLRVPPHSTTTAIMVSLFMGAFSAFLYKLMSGFSTKMEIKR